MSGRPTVPPELWPLLDAVCEGELTPEQRSELDACLHQNPDAQEIYLDHIWLCTQVNAWSRGRRAGAAGLARVAGCLQSAGGGDGTNDELAADAAAGSSCPVHDSSYLAQPFRWLAASAPLSYTFAALVLGVGLLAAWAWKTPGVGRIDLAWQLPPAEQEASPSPQPAAADAGPAIVAKITRMQGLKPGAWKYPLEAPTDPTDVPAGCLYRMGPGVMEIAYHCGAKVAVEGPAEYLVESANRGDLLSGKLTVSVAESPKGPPAQRSTRATSAGGNRPPLPDPPRHPCPVPCPPRVSSSSRATQSSRRGTPSSASAPTRRAKPRPTSSGAGSRWACRATCPKRPSSCGPAAGSTSRAWRWASGW